MDGLPTHQPTRVESHLLDAKKESIDKLVEKWDEEAVDATLAGNPERSWYINEMSSRLANGELTKKEDN